MTDGFAGDHAIVRVNGKTVLDKAERHDQKADMAWR